MTRHHRKHYSDGCVELAEKYKADALRSCAGLKGEALAKAKADIDKESALIAAGLKRVKLKDGEVVASRSR